MGGLREAAGDASVSDGSAEIQRHLELEAGDHAHQAENSDNQVGLPRPQLDVLAAKWHETPAFRASVVVVVLALSLYYASTRRAPDAGASLAGSSGLDENGQGGHGPIGLMAATIGAALRRIAKSWCWHMQVACTLIEALFCFLGYKLWLVDLEEGSRPRCLYPKSLSKKTGSVAYVPEEGSWAYRFIVWYRSRSYKWLLHLAFLLSVVALHVVVFHYLPAELKAQALTHAKTAQQVLKAVQ